MATTVETALGPIPTAELGPTLMHEHIVTRSPGYLPTILPPTDNAVI